MSLQLKDRFKIDFATVSVQGIKRRSNNDSYGKFPEENTSLAVQKGQLFVVADSKSGNPGGRDAGKMSVRIVKENYFTYPSEDIEFCLQRAFDTANRHIYQYAQANNLHRKIGATCSALVLTDKFAYVAHIGDCRVYRISVRKIEQLTQDHTRVLEMLPRQQNRPEPAPQVARRPVLTRALGIKLGIKVDTVNKIPIHRDEYFLLCSDGLNHVAPEDIQNIVLSSSPQQACKKLAALARQSGGRDDVTVQIVKVYNHFTEQVEVETYAHIEDLSARWSNWPIYMMLLLLLLMFAFLLHEPSLNRVSGMFESQMSQYSLVSLDQRGEATAEMMEEQQLIEARDHLESNRWSQALKIYKAVLRNDRAHPEALEGVAYIALARKEKGDEFYQQGRWASALKYYRQALLLQPDNVEYKQLAYDCSYRLEQQNRLAAARNGSNSASRQTSIKTVAEVSRQTILDNHVNGIFRSQWNILGLDEAEDFRFSGNTLQFFENIRIKKAFHQEIYEGVEIEVLADVYGPKKGKYGIIFGHETAGVQPYKNFFLFSIDGNGRYTLEEVTSRSVNMLASEYIRPDVLRSYDQVQLKVKSFGKLILLYANGELLKMVPVDRPRGGGVGLYADPKLRVVFSGLKISPAVYKQK